jgi:hypothetical protein
MGDRANVLMKEDESDSGVYLYTHWAGSNLSSLLQEALQKHWRWDDCPYLTRIVFDTMSEGKQGQETGYGISTRLGDGDNRILVVNCSTHTVSIKGGKTWTFEEYIALSKEQVVEVFG